MTQSELDPPAANTDANSNSISDTLTNLLAPLTSSTLTIRVIKSFQYRTEKSLVLHHLNLETETVGALKDRVRKAIQTAPGWKPYRTAKLDTFKLYTKAHGSKTTNLIINLDNDSTHILTPDTASLSTFGIENETEISFFNREMYEEFKLNPETKWD